MDSVNVALMKVSEALATLMMIRDVFLEKKNDRNRLLPACDWKNRPLWCY